MVFPLHSAQALSPCTRPKALRPWNPSKGLSLAFCAGVVTLHQPHGRCPLDSRQGPFPCIPRRRSALHLATQKNGIVLIPLFVWIRHPDTALVSPSAAQAAHEITGKVEIHIGDFDFPAAFIRSADSLHGARQIAHCFGYCLAHDGLQRIGIRKTGSAVSFFCQRFHDEGCIGARPASQFFQGQTMTGIVQVQPNSEIELVLILQSQHPACGAPLPPAADIL